MASASSPVPAAAGGSALACDADPDAAVREATRLRASPTPSVASTSFGLRVDPRDRAGEAVRDPDRPVADCDPARPVEPTAIVPSPRPSRDRAGRPCRRRLFATQTAPPPDRDRAGAGTDRRRRGHRPRGAPGRSAVTVLSARRRPRRPPARRRWRRRFADRRSCRPRRPRSPDRGRAARRPSRPTRSRRRPRSDSRSRRASGTRRDSDASDEPPPGRSRIELDQPRDCVALQTAPSPAATPPPPRPDGRADDRRARPGRSARSCRRRYSPPRSPPSPAAMSPGSAPSGSCRRPPRSRGR